MAKETVPDRWGSIRQRSLTKRVHAHRGKTKTVTQPSVHNPCYFCTVTQGG